MKIIDYIDWQPQATSDFGTGIPGMPKLKRKAVVQILARPGMGKTSLAAQIALHVSKYYNVYVFTDSCRSPKFAERIFNCISNSSDGNGNPPESGPGERDRILSKLSLQRPISIFEELPQTGHFTETKGADLIVIDRNDTDPIWARSISYDLNASVVMTNTINSYHGEDKGKPPRKRDLRRYLFSGCDIETWFLYREHYYYPYDTSGSAHITLCPGVWDTKPFDVPLRWNANGGVFEGKWGIFGYVHDYQD